MGFLTSEGPAQQPLLLPGGGGLRFCPPPSASVPEWMGWPFWAQARAESQAHGQMGELGPPGLVTGHTQSRASGTTPQTGLRGV